MSKTRNRNENNLTPRQQQVLDCLVAGLTGPQTAEKLGISVHSVHAYAAILRERFNAGSTVEVVAKVTGRWIEEPSCSD